METTAVAKYIRISPQKARLVADVIRGMSADQALTTLRFMPKKGAKIIRKVLESAVANANQSDSIDVDTLYVKRILIDGGPMQTTEQGETLRFGLLVDGVALLASADARPAPRSANLIVRPDQLSTEALFAHADGSFWRRHFTANFTSAGADVILWVFDAAGTRARTWRGSTRRRG